MTSKHTFRRVIITNVFNSVSDSFLIVNMGFAGNLTTNLKLGYNQLLVL